MNTITLIPEKRDSVTCEFDGGHYFMGGLPALMQAVRLLQKDPQAKVTYINDGLLKKSTQSAHQGHVHPTEWTTPELGCWPLTKILLSSLKLIKAAPPEDVVNYSYVHFPLSNLSLGLLFRNIAFKLKHMVISKNGVSEADRWQCDMVRASLDLHKRLNDEIVASGGEPTYHSSWRLIWSKDKKGIEKKRALWSELGIATDYLLADELRKNSLLRTDLGLYGLKVIGDGKFYPDVDKKIVTYLSKKYPNFTARVATVSELYLDNQQPFAVREGDKLISVHSFFGSLGHNGVFMKGSKKPRWNEVPVTGVSTLWECLLPKQELLDRFDVAESALLQHIRELPGTANLTNLHVTIWDAVFEGEQVKITARATEGANFNSLDADLNDLENMKVNIHRFFIGTWNLISQTSCSRKTTTANIPEYKDHFIHGLSGIGFSFSGAPNIAVAAHNKFDCNRCDKQSQADRGCNS